MKKLVLTLFISVLAIQSFAEDLPKTCLNLSHLKAINMTKEKLFNVNEECSPQELADSFFKIPALFLNIKEISNVGMSEVKIEEAIKLLKNEQGQSITEDLIKLMDYYPTILPAKVYIMSYKINEQGEDRKLVLIESKLIKIEEISKHRIIAISKEKINSL